MINKVMKVFRITTKVKATKTIQYIVEANSKEEAEQIREERGEGEEIEDDIMEEILTKTKFIETLED
jgi:hypothetical protein